MIGALYQKQINEILSEFNSTWVDLKTSFDYVWEAAKDFSKETRSHHNSQAISTIATQAVYNLNSDFLEIMARDDKDKYVVSIYDGSYTNWLAWQSYSDCLQSSNSDGTPQSFSVVDAPLLSRITGTASASSSEVGGESTLSSTTVLTSVAVGDTVINTHSGYYGIVLAAGTSLTTAMFDLSSRGGAYASWTSGDTFLIQPAPRYQIILDPAPDTSGLIVTPTYYAKPNPVYSDYGSYPFATGYEEAIIKYAAWLYKYRDSKQSMGDPLYVAYEREMRKAKNVNRKASGIIGFRVNFMK